MSEERALATARAYAEQNGQTVEGVVLGGMTTMTSDGGRRYLVTVRCVDGKPLFVAVVIGPDGEATAGPLTYERS